jgi:type II secretory pathway component PulK
MIDRKGIALITVLWVTVILEMIAASLIYVTRLQVRISDYRLRELQSLALANAGVERGAARIYFCKQLENKIKTMPENYPFSDRGVLGDGEYDFSVENEEGKINLNSGSREQLLKTAMLAGVAGGTQLADFVLARRKEKKKFISLEELAGQPFWNADSRVQLEKYLTVFSNGKINVNCLAPELAFPQLTQQTWDKIKVYRNGSDMLQGTADDRFIDEENLKKLLGEETFSQVEEAVCYRGQAFLIRSRAVLKKKVIMIKRWVKFDYQKGRLVDLCWQES